MCVCVCVGWGVSGCNVPVNLETKTTQCLSVTNMMVSHLFFVEQVLCDAVCQERPRKEQTDQNNRTYLIIVTHTHTQFMFDGEKSIFGIIMCVNVNSMVRKCNCDVTYWLTLSIM